MRDLRNHVQKNPSHGNHFLKIHRCEAERLECNEMHGINAPHAEVAEAKHQGSPMGGIAGAGPD